MNTLLIKLLRWATMIVVPLALVCLEWNHPSGFSKDVYGHLSLLGDWWRNLHIYQSFLFGAVGVGALMLTYGKRDFFSVVSKVAAWLFLVCYLVFDSVGGIAVGQLIIFSQQDPSPYQQETVQALAQNLYKHPIVGGAGSFYSLTGSWAWAISIIAAIASIFVSSAKVPLWKKIPPLLLLALSAYTLYVGHYSPYGPIAFSSFAAASLWFELFKFGPADLNQ